MPATLASLPLAAVASEVDSEQVISATFNVQLAVGAGMLVLCVLAHGIGLFTLSRVLGSDIEKRFENVQPLSFRGTGFTLIVVASIILIHFIEVWLFAFLYDYLRALPTFQDALYFSTISYSTIGYNDASIAEDWRMVAALEGMLGVILLGWSTAFLVRVLSKLEGEGTPREPMPPQRTASD
jgi:hypothetical protein